MFKKALMAGLFMILSALSVSAQQKVNGGLSINGPDPWRDFTSYMPKGGCSSVTNPFPYGYSGSITSGTNALTTNTAADFKDGCGITVNHAGATSTLVLPACTPSTVIRTSNSVSVTCSSNTNLVYTGTGGANGQDQGVTIAGCSDSSMNGTYVLDTNNATTGFTYTSSGSNGSSSGCTVTFLLGWSHGVTGSTTYYYKIASIDSGSGMSAASPAITITNGNATLSPVYPLQNYNVIFYPFVVSSKGTVIYRSTNGTDYTCWGVQWAGIMFADYGTAGPCPFFIPSTPPASPTAKSLTTTIVSGGGTTSLVLATNASNTATTQKVFHDEMPFLTRCVNAANTDQVSGTNYTIGSTGCFVPYGVWHMNSDWPTDTVDALGGGISIAVAGTFYMGEWPMILGKGSYSVYGIGYSGGQTNASNYPTTETQRAVTLPGTFVIRASSINLSGFSTSFGWSHAMYIGMAPDGRSGPSGVKVKRMLLGVQDTSTSVGLPVVIGGNTFKIEFDDVALTPRSDWFPASILFTTDSYRGIGGADHEFNHINFVWHQTAVNAPGGFTGQGFSFGFNTVWSEEHGQVPTGGFITLDTGDATHVGARLAGMSMYNMQNADASNKTFLEVYGTNNISGNVINLLSVDQFNPIMHCHSLALGCQDGGISFLMTSNSAEVLTGSSKYTGPSSSGAVYHIGAPTKFDPSYGVTGVSPAYPVWADTLATPKSLAITSISSGSLSAGQYCMIVVGIDDQSTPGKTLPSPEVCQTVGSSSSILINWTTYENGQSYKNFYLYYGSTSGGENNYIDMGLTPGNTTAFSYNFTTTASAIGGSITTDPTAYISWFNRDISQPSCLLCTPTASASWQLGIGDKAPDSGDKLSVKGGFLNAKGGLRLNSVLLASSTAPTISSGFGSTPSIVSSNGSAAFTVNVGTGGSATGGVLTMPAAATGWACSVNDITAAAGHVAYNTRQTASSTTSVTVENQTTSSGAAVAWAASDVLRFTCSPY